MKRNNMKLRFDSDRCVGRGSANTANRVIALILVFALLPIWGIPDAFALGQSSLPTQDELTVTADVVGGEEALPIPEAVLSADIEQEVPEDFLVAYQWQRAAALGVSDLPETVPPTEIAPGVSGLPETVPPTETASAVSKLPEPERESTPAPGVSDLLEPTPAPLVPEWEDIPGAVEATYTLTTEDVGQYVRVNVIVAQSTRKLRAVQSNTDPLAGRLAVSNPVLVQPREFTVYLKDGGKGDGTTRDKAVGTLLAAVQKIPANGSGVIQLVGAEFTDTELKYGEDGFKDYATLGIIDQSAVTIRGDNTTPEGRTTFHARNVIILRAEGNVTPDKFRILTLENVIMDGEDMSAVAQDNPFIQVNKGILNLESGSVIQNFHQKFSPIYLTTGYVYMKEGAEICHNRMTRKYERADSLLQFGPGRGGAVTIAAGTFIMQGGSIHHNEVSDVTGKGSAVYLYANTNSTQWVPRLYVLGGSITNNVAAGGANGAVFVSNRGNTNSSTGKTPGLFVGGSAYIANNTVPGGIGSVYLEQGMTMGIYQWSLNMDIDLPAIPLTNGAKISLTAAVPARSVMIVTNVRNWQDADYFVMDTPQYGLRHNPLINALVMTVDNRIFLNPSAPTNGDGSQTNPYNTWAAAYEKATSGTTIMLMNPLTLTDTLELKSNKTLVLQGYDGTENQNANQTITGGGQEGMFHVSDENLALRNITLQGTGRETAPLLKLSASGAVTLGSGSALLNGGAGGAQVDGGTLMLLPDSKVEGNTAQYGGGISVEPSGYLDLQGGVISGNTATAAGGGVYTKGTVNLRGNVSIQNNHSTLGGAEIPDNLRLRTGKVVNIVGALSGNIGVAADDPPPRGAVRVFAVNGKNDAVNQFSLDNPGKMSKTQRGGNLLITNYSNEARLSTLKRVGVASAGENLIIETPVPTDADTLNLVIPYAVKEPTTKLTFVAEARVDEGVQATKLECGGKTATGQLTFEVDYNPSAVGAGEKVTSFPIDGTAQDGVTTKHYTVTLQRGYPKLTGNNTVNVTFNKPATETEQSNSIIIDALRGNSTIKPDSFHIRAKDAGVNGTNLENIAVSAIHPTTGELTVMVQHAFLAGNVNESGPGVNAGQITLSLWIGEFNMGNFIVNMLEVDSGLIDLYKAVATYSGWDTAYPKEAYVRKEDKPDQGYVWGNEDLLSEDDFGKWEGTPEEQAQEVKALLDVYATDAAKKVIQKLIDESTADPKPDPKYRLQVESTYDKTTHATNASPDYPNGFPGKYTFRVDVVLQKQNNGGDGAALAGQTRTVAVVPKQYNGLTTDQLYDALQNEQGKGALDGVLSETVWVPENASAEEIGTQIHYKCVTKRGSIIRNQLNTLKDQYPNMVFEPLYPEGNDNHTLVRNNGVYYILDLTVRARSMDPMDLPEEVFAKVEVRLKIELKDQMSVGLVLLDRAQQDILEALANGDQAIADIPSASATGQAAVEALLRSGLQKAITTPEGTLIQSELITLEPLTKPLSELVTVELRSRSVDAFVPPVNGTATNPTGVDGQYAFIATLHTVDADKPLSVPLPLAPSGEVVLGTASGGSLADNGVVLFPKEYNSPNNPGNDDDDDDDDSSTSQSKPTPTPTPTPKPTPAPAVTAVKTPGGTDTTPPSSTPASAPASKPADKTPGVPQIPGSENVVLSLQANPTDGLATRFADDQAVIRAALTPEELKLIASGQKIEIALKVNKVTLESPDAVPADDRAMIKAEADKNKLSLGVYLDIKVEKRIGDGEWISVTNLGEAIRVTMDIPPELHKAGRIFSLVRAHNGEVAILPNVSDDHKTISFETDRFSTYAIVYSDTEFAEDVQTVSTWCSALLLGAGIGAAALAVCGLALLLMKRRKRSAAK